jgi:dTDP-4-dehydrorhamnose 3,5-epimerase
MIFEETRLRGAYLLDLRPIEDKRGFFARTWCRRELEEHGLTAEIAQANMSYNHHAGTLRGMHLQRPPFSEVKIVQCIRGAVHDVIIDLRPGSPTRGEWIGVELTAENHRMLYVPEGFAHGYLTLTDHAEVAYMVSQFYTPEAEGGVRHDDPAFGIRWPAEVRVISDKDRDWPDYTPG